MGSNVAIIPYKGKMVRFDGLSQTQIDLLLEMASVLNTSTERRSAQLVGAINLHESEYKINPENRPNIYKGELNLKRIKTIHNISERYNLQEGTVRDLFCAGADFYRDQIK